jgi:hypothetical protein
VVKLSSQQVGKCGELLVQCKLLKYGIESSHLTTDHGIDLVAFHSSGRRTVTVQVKTSTHHGELGDRWLHWSIKESCPAEFVAAVDLNRDIFWLFRIDEFKKLSRRVGKGEESHYRLWWYVPEDTPEKAGEKTSRNELLGV